MNIKFKKFNYHAQIEQQQELFNDCFPEVINYDKEGLQTGVNNYLWQYQSFPKTPSSREYIAMDDEKIVAYYAALPFRYNIGNKEVETGMVCGVMTSPNYRKIGLFYKLGNYASEQQKKENVSFNLTFPIRKAIMPGFIKSGWDIAFELPLFVKFLKLTSLMKTKKIGLLAFLFNPFISLYNKLRYTTDNLDYKVVNYDKIDEIKGYDDFQKKWNQSVTNSLIKDRDFLRWRYGFPNRKVSFICAYIDFRLVGFVSLSPIKRMGVESYGILDFMVVDDNCLPNLHNAISERAKKNDKEAIMMMMSNYSSKKYLLGKNAYFKSPFKFHLIIKNLISEFPNDKLMKESLWHLMFVDSDDL